MKTRLIAFVVSILICTLYADAQEWMKIHHNLYDTDWTIPLEISKYKQYDFNNKEKSINAIAIKPDSTEMIVPFDINDIDSISFGYDLTDEEKGHNKYRPFTMHITTEDYANIVEKEVWLNCHISIDGKGEYSDYSGTGRIRGRGNSSWEWYNKKPYKFKLDEKSKLLGMEKAKNWNLLANYRDVTDMMNIYAFTAARYMGMPNTVHSRFVEVFLNGEYIGTYQLTEKIEINKNRIDIDEEEGVLLSFDKDDGPELSPYATDNFWSLEYRLPMCVKHPEDPIQEQITNIANDFQEVEKAIKNRDYEMLDSLVDIPSYISMLQMHEYLFNVEIGAPRSMYMYKDKGGKYTFGPVWDWDAAFDFRWDDMTTGHTFFSSTYEFVLGNEPVSGSGAYEKINMFWRNMFGNATFVKQYKDKWNSISGSINKACWEETQKYIDALTNEGTYSRDCDRWPLVSSSGWWNTTYFTPNEEIIKMKDWLTTRVYVLNDVINKYPDGIDSGEAEVVGTIKKTQTCKKSSGYNQSSTIYIDRTEVETLLGGSPESLVPLNADGTQGDNTAAKAYGAWFDSKGNTNDWGNDSHIYIESNDMYEWAFGCHPDICRKGDSHTVTMQYRKARKAVNVTVTFTIN